MTSMFQIAPLRKKLGLWLQHMGQKLYPDNSGQLPNPPQAEVGDNCGETIFRLGWRQGSFFPIESLQWPEKDLGSRNDALAIICSQSCDVVSNNLKKTPYVEVIIAHPLKQKYKPKAQEAIGKDQKRLFLKVEGIEGVEALEVCINHRFEMPRESLVNAHPPDTIKLAQGEARKLMNWLARRYLRVALPNALVALLKLHIFPNLEKWLESQLSSGVIINSEVDTIYVTWSPDNESENYRFDIRILTDNEDVQKDFDLKLRPNLKHLMEKNETGLEIKVCECQLKEETYLSDIKGYRRFSDYDYLTSLNDWQHLLGSVE